MNYQEIIVGLEEQLKNFIGNKKAVIGISGGIDSAVVATLCVRALGKENVLGVLIPYGNQDTTDSKLLINFLEIENKEVNIKEIVDKFDFLDFNDVEKGNIMARVRMITLYSFANKLNGLVIGTGNKSEIEIGYFTKYGDGGVDVEPIGNLYKIEVYEIAKILKIPQELIDKKPSADLWEGQTDEDEIGATYAEIDSILKEEVNQGATYEKIQQLRKNSNHKNKMPPIFKVK